MPVNFWDSSKAELLQGRDQLVYRSNLLGLDRTICNWGGGNTSLKTIETDFTGRTVRVLWVKGSGSDLATAKASNFTAIRLDDVIPLMDREQMSDEEMVDYLSRCKLEPQHPRMSIETLLHAFLPFNHVDHTHPDAIISLCCADNGKEKAKEIFGDRFVWVPYVRPGFTLSKLIAEGVMQNPKAELVLMEKHGLVTWGETSEESYHRTLVIIQEAEDYISKHTLALGDKLFGGGKFSAFSHEERQNVVARIMPAIRGAVSSNKKMVLHFDDSDDVLRFVNSVDAPRLSQVGAACPDHLVHTKRIPLYVDWEVDSSNVDELKGKLLSGVNKYQDPYMEYFEKNRGSKDVMSEPAPRVILIPGIGMITTGKSKFMAEVSAALYHRAIAVMGGATALGNFVSLDETESFAVEYWPLELYKLSLAPPEAEFSRKVIFITGGAGGIGRATAGRFVNEGASVVLADLNFEGAREVADELVQQYGDGCAIAAKMDVTNEELVRAAIKDTILYYGGIDVLVNNAGLATSNPFEETSLEEWNLNMNVLTTGYFLVAREVYRVMREQEIGGAMVFVASKNSVYAGRNASAYSAAKAAEAHLARCIAAEGGPYGIRVNSVLPDAVLQGSAIWNSSWRDQRAKAYGIESDQLEEYYRMRTTLQVNVYPQDIAEAIAFLSSSKAGKTTGCMITVDGGVPAAFTR